MTGSRVVSPSEGNETKRDGNQGFGVFHSTEEAGELHPAGPGGGKGTPVYSTMEGNVTETPSSENTSTKLHRIATLAREIRDERLSTLSYHIDVAFLTEAFRRTRKDGAVGVDGQTAQEYEQDLESNLRDLLNRAKSGTYRAPPVRRVEIPKGNGATRPIGIPTFEDKVLQRAVSMILEAIYEQSFEDFSYGFRPQRSAHQALESVSRQVAHMYGGWVVEVDIRNFFDNLDHRHLREVLNKRVGDGVIQRLVGKWLNAGVMTNQELVYPNKGTPQGGVISPILANIYLDEVVDKWWSLTVVPRLAGRGIMVRYADDMIMLFEHRRDARRMMRVLPKRFGSYGLELHPEKTRMVRFEPADKRGNYPDDDPPGPTGTFDFLGFTLYWRRTHRGKWRVNKKTAKDRLRRTLKRFNLWMKRNRHLPVRTQHAYLARALTGHYAYYGVTGNGKALASVHHHISRMWRNWLSRRNRCGLMPWKDFLRILRHYPLPPPRIVHSAYRRANL